MNMSLWAVFFRRPTPRPHGDYDELRADLILTTLGRLCQRIEERFPQSGLGKVAGELAVLGSDTMQLTDRLQRPNWWVRGATVVGILAIVGFTVGLFSLSPELDARVDGVTDLVQIVESLINDAIFLALALFFVGTLETRYKRNEALASLHRLRSIAHVVDMHQLTKDPAYLLTNTQPTPSSPVRHMDLPTLARYLDYCSELLSLTSKLAALHVQYFNDAVVLNAVNDLENLAHGLSSKIWQKIMILDLAEGRVVR